jgi:Cytochrome P450
MENRVRHLISFIREKCLSSPAQTSDSKTPGNAPPSYVYKPVDFARIAQYSILDVISDVAFGKPFGFLEVESDIYHYIDVQEIMLPLVEMFGILPFFRSMRQIGWIGKHFRPKPTDKFGLGRLMGVTSKIVDQRYAAVADAKAEPKSDMLSSFIRHGMPKEQAKLETVMQVIAGADTTVTTLRMTVLFVSTSPPTLRRLLAELDAADKGGLLTKPIARDSEIRTHLPYLCACVKETLRIWPPVTGFNYRKVPKGGDTVNGLHLPGGTSVGWAAWSMHRSKDIYGEDSNVYRPDRWTDTKDEVKLAEMNRTADLVFSYGRYVCLGKSVATMELHKFLTEVGSCFFRPICEADDIQAVSAIRLCTC